MLNSNTEKGVNNVQPIKGEIQELVEKYSEVFRDELGEVNNFVHHIEIKNETPFKKKFYPISAVYEEEVARQVRELEELKIIKKEASEFVNPLVAVKKKNDEIRICVDAREVNDRMRGDHTQPPTFDEIVARMSDRKIFTTLDISKAFWQIPLDEKSKKYTGFMFRGQTTYLIGYRSD